jgi:hypothetical protein
MLIINQRGQVNLIGWRMRQCFLATFVMAFINHGSALLLQQRIAVPMHISIPSSCICSNILYMMIMMVMSIVFYKKLVYAAWPHLLAIAAVVQWPSQCVLIEGITYLVWSLCGILIWHSMPATPSEESVVALREPSRRSSGSRPGRG